MRPFIILWAKETKGEGRLEVLESSFCCGLGREAGRQDVFEVAEECRRKAADTQSSLLTPFHPPGKPHLEVEAKILVVQPLAASLLRQESRVGKAEQKVWVGRWKIASTMEEKNTGLGPVRSQPVKAFPVQAS